MRWNTPKKPIAVIVLAHGAGAGMEHPWMEKLAAGLCESGIATLRFNFPYMQKKQKRPDPPAVAVAAIAKAVAAAKKKYPKLPLFVGGKSFGGRMSTTAAAAVKLDGVRGIVCFGFPLHPPKKPGVERAEHLARVKLPILFLQGTRDDLADLKLIRRVVKKHPQITLHLCQGADHGFHVLKSSGRTPDEVWEELRSTAVDYMLSRPAGLSPH